MNKEQIDLLGEYIKAKASIILIEQIPENIIEKGAVILDANCSNTGTITGTSDYGNLVGKVN